MRRPGTLAVFVLYAFSLGAQDTTLTFKVRDAEMKVSVHPSDSILWTEQANPIHIRIKGGKKLGGVFVKGASKTGSKAVCFTKKYWIKKCSQPIIKICGVVKDSVLDLWDFHIRNSITAYLPEKKIYIPVLSFAMVCNGTGGNDTLVGYGNKFNLTMREKLFRMKPGSTLTVCDIEVMYPGGRKKIIPPVQVFLAETGKRKVGN